jgi:hypothetical protein
MNVNGKHCISSSRTLDHGIIAIAIALQLLQNLSTVVHQKNMPHILKLSNFSMVLQWHNGISSERKHHVSLAETR